MISNAIKIDPKHGEKRKAFKQYLQSQLTPIPKNDNRKVQTNILRIRLKNQK